MHVQKKRILFVDDEVNVLNGLRRMLYPMRERWEMVFAESGPAALACMAQAPFDLIITDMRMPGMDGEQLLTIVRERYPHTMRFVLTGYTDKDVSVLTAGLAHQLISKPCNPEMLRDIIGRTHLFQPLIPNPAMRKMLGAIEVLPTLPSVYLELKNLLGNPGVSPHQIGELLSRDIGLTTKVLQLVNSAFFSLRARVTDPGKAVALLGLDTLHSLLDVISIFNHFDNEHTRPHIEEFYAHALRVGRRARVLALQMEPECDPMMAMLGGMLHDVGKLILCSYLPEAFLSSMQKANKEDIPLYIVEREILGFTHAEAGGYLLGLWGFDEEVLHTVAFHHEPSLWPEKSALLTVVHVANVLDRGIRQITPSMSYLNWNYLQNSQITPSMVAEWATL